MPFCCCRKLRCCIKFDPKSFCDDMYYIGRPYRHRAIELIKICQSFSVTSEQSLGQHTKLLSVIQECDEAISYAITSRSGKKESQEADDKFDEAIRRLSDYESEFHSQLDASLGSVDDRMRAAAENDNRRKDKERDQSHDNTLRVVKFHILKSLPCNKPVIVKQALSSRTDIRDPSEVLWNFSHFKGEERLTLAQNPHFYENLPVLPDDYGGEFKRECIKIKDSLPDRISVLPNSSRRVYFNFTGNQRVFNVWKTERALVFKDVSGNIQGEAIVKGSIRPSAPPSSFFYCRRHSQGPPEKAEVEVTNDWMSSIRTAADDTTRTHICISAPSTQRNGRVE